MEIDQFNRMWVVDVGRRNLFEGTPNNKCAPKILLIDLNTDKIIRSYEFPADVVSRNSSFLNDIVVGCTNETDCIAYISDARDAKIIVYDLCNDKSWFVKHPSMLADPNALLITIQGKNYTFDTAVDGIALSNRDSNFGTVYYSPLSSYNVYSIPAVTAKQAGAKNQAGVQLEDADVSLVGRKPSQTDGMTMDANGVLYYGLLGTSGINSWNTSEASITDANQVVVAQNDEDLQWPDTFAIDQEGYLYATPNRLHLYNSNSLNFTDVNFRVVRFCIHTKSYMFPTSDVPTTS
jgi:sugar lactone lactonase YvrE